MANQHPKNAVVQPSLVHWLSMIISPQNEMSAVGGKKYVLSTMIFFPASSRNAA